MAYPDQTLQKILSLNLCFSNLINETNHFYLIALEDIVLMSDPLLAAAK